MLWTFRWRSCWTCSWAQECHGHQDPMLMTLDWSTSMQHLPSLKSQLADPMPLSQLHVLHWKDTETGIRCMVPGESNLSQSQNVCPNSELSHLHWKSKLENAWGQELFELHPPQAYVYALFRLSLLCLNPKPLTICLILRGPGSVCCII